MRAIFVVLFSLVLMGFCFSVNIDACEEIDTPGTYYLTSDVSGAPYVTAYGDTCMDITADDVVLDCQGHSISHDGSGYGILVNSPGGDVTVQNCVVHDYTEAITVNGTASTQFIDNLVYDSEEAFLFTSTGDNTLTGNEIRNVSLFLFFTLAGPNTLENNIMSNNTAAALFFTDTLDKGENTLTNNDMSNLLGSFLFFTNTSDNTMIGNDISNPGGSYLFFSTTEDNIFNDNIVTNADSFLYFTETGDNTVDGNTFSLPPWGGSFLHFYTTGDNVVTNNDFENYTFGSFLMFGDTGHNTLSNNDFDLIGGGSFLMFTDTGDNTVEDNRLRMNGSGAFLMFSETGDNTVQDNRFQNDSWGSFFIFDGTDSNTVSGNMFDNTRGSYFMFHETSDNTVEGNKIDDYATGLYFNFETTENNIVNENIVHGASGTPLLFSGTGDNTVNGNIIYGADPMNSLSAAFMFDSTGDNTVRDNEVYNLTDGDAFFFSGTGNNTVRDNSLYDVMLSNAFMFMDTQHNNVDDNHVAGIDPIYPVGDAFYFDGTRINTVRDNSVHTILGSAFMFFETWGNTVEDNTAAGHDPVHSLEDAFTFAGTLGNTVTGNSAYNISSGAFYFEASSGDNVLEDNYAAGGNAMYPMDSAFALFSTGHNTLINNEARNVSSVAFYLSDTEGNLLEDNIAAGAAPMQLLEMAFIFEGTGDNNLENNYAYDVYGIAFYFAGTGDNNLTDSYALTDDPRSIDGGAFIFMGTGDNTLTNSHASDVAGMAFTFEGIDGNNALTDSTAYGKQGSEGMEASLGNDTLKYLESFSGYGGEPGVAAFYFGGTYNNTLTNTEVHSFEDALFFEGTINNELDNTSAYDIAGDVLWFQGTSNNTLTDTTVIDPAAGFVFEGTNSVTLVNSYLYNASDVAFYFGGIEGNVSLANTEYDGILNPLAVPELLMFNGISGGVDLTDTSSNIGRTPYSFMGIGGDVTLDNSYHLVAVGSAFYFEGIDGEVTLTDSTYEGVPSIFPVVFYFGGIGEEITITNAYASSVSDVYTFEDTDDVTVTNAEVFGSNEEAFIFATDGDVTVSDSTSGYCSFGMYVDYSDVTVSNHHFYDNGVDFFVQGDGHMLELNNAVFDRRSADKSVQTTLSVDDDVVGRYRILYSYQPDDLPANHGSFAGKFLEIENLTPSLSIDEVTWHWDQSEVNNGGYTESEFELWKYDGSSWGGAPINGTPDTTNNEFTQYGFEPDSVYAILEDNADAVNCQVITSPGTYQMTGDYLGAVTYMGELGGDACVLIDASDVTFDCRGHRIIALEEDTISAGVGITPGQSDVVVKNCVISGYSDGIYGDELTNAEFTGNDISDAFYGGIKVNDITGELVVSDNTIHNSLLASDAFGGVYFDNDFEYDPEDFPTGATVTVEDNTMHHLYCHEDAQSCGIGGFFADDFYDEVTITGNEFYQFLAEDIEIASAAFGYRSTVTDNTAHHVYAITPDGSAYSAGFAALASSVSDDTPAVEPEVTLANNEIYEYYVLGNESAAFVPMVAVALSVQGYDGVQTTVSGNSVHDVAVQASNDNALLYGTIVVGVSAEMIEAPVEISGNEFYNAYAYSFTDSVHFNAFLMLNLNADELELDVSENDVHHLYSSSAQYWEGETTAFRLVPIFHSSAELNIDNNSIHHLYSNSRMAGLWLTPYTIERINIWEQEGSLSTPPHELGATAEEKEFMSAITGASASDGYGYADDIEFMAKIRDNSVHDFTGGYGVTGLMLSGTGPEGSNMRANRSADADAVFTGNSIHHLFSSIESEGMSTGILLFGLWPNVTVGPEGEQQASANGENGPAATGEVTATITDNTVHHLSSYEDDATGIVTSGVVCNSFGYGEDQCAATSTIEDNTVHNLMSNDGSGIGIVQVGTLCLSKECSAEHSASRNTIHHISGMDEGYGIMSAALVCVALDIQEFAAPAECSAVSTSDNNTVYDIHSNDDLAYGVLNRAAPICIALSGGNDSECSADASISGNTVHHLAGFGSGGLGSIVSVCAGIDPNPSDDECTSTLEIDENNANNIYSYGEGPSVGIGAIAMLALGDAGASLEDNQVSQVHGNDPIGILTAQSLAVAIGAEEGAESASAETDVLKFPASFDLAMQRNTVQDLSGVVPIGMLMTGITCMGQGADCMMDSTVADNTVRSEFAEEASLGTIVAGVECMGYGYASDTCGVDSTIADNEGSNLVADGFAGALLVTGVNCYGYGPSCEYDNIVAENTMNGLSSFGEALGIGVQYVACVEGGEEAQAEGDVQCNAPLVRENLVHDMYTHEDILGIVVGPMDKAEVTRNTVHDVYAQEYGEPDEASCMGIWSIPSATISGNLLHHCSNGLAVANSSVNVTPLGGGYNHLYNTKGVDAYMGRIGDDTVMNVSRLVFDSNADSFSRYTMLSVFDISDNSYTADHAEKPRPLPEGFISFEGKFINISLYEEAQYSLPQGIGEYLDPVESGLLHVEPSRYVPDLSGLIPEWPAAPAAKEQPAVQPLSTEYGREGLTWHWFDSEAEGYNEADLQLWVCLEERPEGAEGFVADCEWVLLNDTPDTEGNMLSYWEGLGGSVFAILHNGSKTPVVDDEPEDRSMDLGFITNCYGNVVTVTKSGGDPLYGASVRVLDADSLVLVASGSTDSNGEFDFPGCGFTVDISVEKGGYTSESTIKSLVTCEECEEGCLTDADCPEGYVCEDGECVPEPECVDDKDCPEGYECKNGECVPEELECTEDSHCADDEYCEDNECKPVTGQCGYAEDHEWVTYACGREAGCPDCPEGLVCENRKCVATGLDCPESVFVGTEETCRAAMNGDVCARCDYIVTDPTGREYTGQTDENGDILLPFDLEGLYRVALVKDGEVVSEVQVEVVPKAPPTEEEKPTEEVVEDVTWLWLLVLLALLVVAFLYWRRRKGEKVAKTKKKKK